MKQRTKRTWAACLAVLWLVLPAMLQAQVHIGGNTDAVKGALLDLTTPEGANLGLLPLNVSIEDINEIPDAFTNKASITAGDLQGLIVYNINPDLPDGAGLYVWDGEIWHFINAAVPVNGVTVSPTTATLTTVGATQQLTPTVLPAAAANKTVTWSSSNTAIATVSASGLVTAVSSGQATITVKTEDGEKTATSDITVNIPVSSVVITTTPATMTTVNGTQTLAATVTPSLAITGATLSWSSGTPAVATVSASGVVTALKTGTTSITASAGGVTSAAKTVTVNIPVSSVVITTTPATMTTVNGTQTLAATVTPSLAITGATLSWSSGTPAVATVNASGVVTALSSGNTSITAKAGTVTSAAKTVTVAIPATSVSVSPTTKAFTSKTTQQLTATILPATAVKTVTWSSNNTAVATVSSSGVVTAVGNGNATITVTTTSGKTATCAVTVSIAGSSTATIGSNTYTTYCYSGTIGCWMVTNSKEGTANYTNGNNKYYQWSLRNNACVSPWAVPTEAQWKTLQNYINGSATAAEKAMWNSGAALAGSYLDATLGNSGGWGRWWSTTTSTGFAASLGGDLTGPTKVSASYTSYFTVRCIKN